MARSWTMRSWIDSVESPSSSASGHSFASVNGWLLSYVRRRSPLEGVWRRQEIRSLALRACKAHRSRVDSRVEFGRVHHDELARRQEARERAHHQGQGEDLGAVERLEGHGEARAVVDRPEGRQGEGEAEAVA